MGGRGRAISLYAAALAAAWFFVVGLGASRGSEDEAPRAAGGLRLSLLDTDGGDPAAPDNIRLRVDLPVGHERLVPLLRARQFRIQVYPETLSSEVGRGERYRADGVFLWAADGTGVYLDVRRPPRPEGAGSYRVWVELAPSGTAALSGLAPERLRYEGPVTDVVLAVDISKSMNGNDPRGRRYAAARAFARIAGDESRIGRLGVVRFNHRADTVLPLVPVSDAAAFDRALDAMGPNTGLTNLDAALETALALLGNAERRGAIVLLTDGKNEGTRYRETHRLAAARGIPIYTVGLGAGTDRDLLGRMAVETKGRFFDAASDRDLLGIYQGLAARLGKRPLLARAAVGPGGVELDLPVDDAVRRLLVFADGFRMRAIPPSGAAVSARYGAGGALAGAGAPDVDVRDPERGEWRLSIAAGDAKTVLACARTGLFPELFPPVVSGRRVRFGATLAADGVAVAGARLWLPSSGGRAPITLHDDGAHGDGLPDDGVYGAEVEMPRELSGEIMLELRAAGVTPGGWPFTRLLPDVRLFLPAMPSVSPPPPARTVEEKPTLAARPGRLDLGRARPGETVSAVGQIRYRTAQMSPLRLSVEPVSGVDAEDTGGVFEVFPENGALSGSGLADWSVEFRVHDGAAPGVREFVVVIELGSVAVRLPGRVEIATLAPPEPVYEVDATPLDTPLPDVDFLPDALASAGRPAGGIPPPEWSSPFWETPPAPVTAESPVWSPADGDAPAITPPTMNTDWSLSRTKTVVMLPPRPSPPAERVGPETVVASMPVGSGSPSVGDGSDGEAAVSALPPFSGDGAARAAARRVWLGWLPYALGCLLLAVLMAWVAFWLARRLWRNRAARFALASLAANAILMILFALALGGGRALELVREERLTVRLVEWKADFGLTLTADEQGLLRLGTGSAVPVAEEAGVVDLASAGAPAAEPLRRDGGATVAPPDSVLPAARPVAVSVAPGVELSALARAPVRPESRPERAALSRPARESALLSPPDAARPDASSPRASAVGTPAREAAERTAALAPPETMATSWIRESALSTDGVAAPVWSSAPVEAMETFSAPRPDTTSRLMAAGPSAEVAVARPLRAIPSREIPLEILTTEILPEVAARRAPSPIISETGGEIRFRDQAVAEESRTVAERRPSALMPAARMVSATFVPETELAERPELRLSVSDIYAASPSEMETALTPHRPMTATASERDVETALRMRRERDAWGETETRVPPSDSEARVSRIPERATRAVAWTRASDDLPVLRKDGANALRLSGFAASDDADSARSASRMSTELSLSPLPTGAWSPPENHAPAAISGGLFRPDGDAPDSPSPRQRTDPVLRRSTPTPVPEAAAPDALAFASPAKATSATTGTRGALPSWSVDSFGPVAAAPRSSALSVRSIDKAVAADARMDAAPSPAPVLGASDALLRAPPSAAPVAPEVLMADRSATGAMAVGGLPATRATMVNPADGVPEILRNSASAEAHGEGGSGRRAIVASPAWSGEATADAAGRRDGDAVATARAGEWARSASTALPSVSPAPLGSDGVAEPGGAGSGRASTGAADSTLWAVKPGRVNGGDGASAPRGTGPAADAPTLLAEGAGWPATGTRSGGRVADGADGSGVRSGRTAWNDGAGEAGRLSADSVGLDGGRGAGAARSGRMRSVPVGGEEVPVLLSAPTDLLRPVADTSAEADGPRRTTAAAGGTGRARATSAVEGIEAGLVVVGWDADATGPVLRASREAVDRRLAGQLRVDWRSVVESGPGVLRGADLLTVHTDRLPSDAAEALVDFARSGGLVWLDGAHAELAGRMAEALEGRWTPPPPAWGVRLPSDAALLWRDGRLAGFWADREGGAGPAARTEVLLMLLGHLGAPGGLVAAGRSE